MAVLETAGLLLVALLFGVVGYYLVLIAKFYRQKFRKGPSHRFMFAGLVLLVVGLVLRSGPFAFVPAFVPALLVCTGGIGFSSLAYLLYRTMMSIG